MGSEVFQVAESERSGFYRLGVVDFLHGSCRIDRLREISRRFRSLDPFGRFLNPLLFPQGRPSCRILL